MLINILKFIFVLLEVVVLFNLIIVVHELGHFLAARWRGLVVEKFGVWFGKPIWKKTINGVEYSLGTIPFGGFVALPQLAPMETLEGESKHDKKQLPPITALDKIIVAFAGPLFSFLLAIFFAVVVFFVGRPVSEADATTVIGYVEKDSPAAKAGLLPGDKILEVDGQPVTRFGGMGADSIVWRIVRSEGDVLPVKIQRGSETISVEAVPLKPQKSSWWKRKSLRQIEIYPAAAPVIAQVEKGSSEEKDGFQRHDILRKVNGEQIWNLNWLLDWFGRNPGVPVTLTVERAGSMVEIPFTRPEPTVVDMVQEGGPAHMAGLKSGDRILEVNGQAVAGPAEISKIIGQNSGKEITLTALRGAERQTFKMTPEVPRDEKNARIGLQWKTEFRQIVWSREGITTPDHPGPFEQIRSSVAMIINTFDALFSPKTGVGAQHMSGPIMIFNIYYQMFQSPHGWQLALWFSVVLNVNLAILNMLPFPVLDGGHITIALVEAIRRKPINVRLLEFVQTGCAMLLLGYMLYVTFFDVGDLFGGGEKKTRFQRNRGAETSETAAP